MRPSGAVYAAQSAKPSTGVPLTTGAGLARAPFEAAPPPLLPEAERAPDDPFDGSAPGSALWHGVELDDLSALVESVVPGEQIVPLFAAKNAKEVIHPQLST